MKKFPVYTIALCTLILLSGCTKNADNSEVLAHVGDTVITRADVDRELQRFLGGHSGEVEASVRQTVLESLVQKRAMVLASEKELDEKEQKSLAEQVARYRDNELIKTYMRKHTQPRPVTEEMVLAEYQAHPERFGGTKVKHYKMLITPVHALVDAQDRKNEILQKFQVSDDWSALQKSAQAQGLNVRIQEGKASDAMLHEQLRSAVQGLVKGQTSDLITIGNNSYMMRVTGESAVGPRPLDQVRPEIRKYLAAEVLKENIRQSSELAMKQVEIKVLDTGKDQ